MLAGDLYIADDPELARDYQRAMALMERFNATPAADPDSRQRILEDLLGGCGEGSEIRPPLYCDYGYQIHIGARTFANFGLVALDVAKIGIGDDVQFGPNVQLLTPTDPTDAKLRRSKWEAARPIMIADNAWLGGGAIVLAGVSIGENAIVGAGAVVTKDVPPNSIVVGNPARVVRPLSLGRKASSETHVLIHRSAWKGSSPKLDFRLKLSEESWRYPKRGPTRHPNRPVRPVLAPIRGSNTRPKRNSNPFSDSFLTEFCEARKSCTLSGSPKRRHRAAKISQGPGSREKI